MAPPPRPAAGQSTALVPFVQKALTPEALRLGAIVTRKCASVVGRVAIAVALIGAVGFALLYARLVYSPMSMSFLVPPIEKAVNRALTGLHFDIGDAVLRRSDSGLGIEFRLTTVRLVDESDSPIVESPFASANISLRALLTGRLAAGEIDLIGPRLFLQYSEERGLALSFADPRESKTDLDASKRDAAQGWAVSTTEPEQPVAGAQSGQPLSEGMIRDARGRAVSFTRAFKDIFAATRRGESAYLTSFAIRDATVYFDRGEQITRWNVPSLEIDLQHRGRNSAVLGSVSVQSPAGAFQLQFQAGQNRKTGQLALSLAVEDLVPRAFSADFPSLQLPKMWNMPVSVAADLELAGNGDIETATVRAKLKHGEFYAPWDPKHPALIDTGEMNLAYSREQGLITLSQAEIRWGNSRLKLSGNIQRQRESGHWAFKLAADDLALGAEKFGIPVIPLDRMLAEGEYKPKLGAVQLDRFLIQAADAHINLAGTFTQGRTSPAIKLAGQVSPMPIAFFKLIWPKFVANGAWSWIGERVPTGRIAGGTVNIDIPADVLASLAADSHLPPEAVDFRLDLEDMDIRYVESLPPMHVAKATAAVTGQRFFLTVPEGEVVLPSGGVVYFNDGQFIVGDLRPRVPSGEIHFKSEASAAHILELLNQPSLGYVSALEMKIPDVTATVSSTFSIAMPMLAALKFKDMKLNGRSRLADIRATNLPGGIGVDGGTLDFDVTEKALEARGDLSMNGLRVLVAWQRIFDAPTDRQPPLRLRTVLDEATRAELGLDVNHMLVGGVPAELTVNFRKALPPLLHFEANLSDVDILMASLGWRKPPGQRAVLTLDIDPAEGSGLELKNVNVQGDDLNVRGTVKINDKRKPVAFNLPVVALNAQTQLEMNGEIDRNNVWQVRVKGKSYDGRQFFRSLFSAGQIADDQPLPPKDEPGMDAQVDIETVIGFFDTSLQNVSIEAKRRNTKLTYLNLHGQLNGKSPLAARIEGKKNQPRQIMAEATDAGAAFRLVGFYPSARGGEVSLKVDLDGTGATQKVGMLYARNFVIANDQIVEEVLSGPKAGARPKPPQRPQQTYDQLQFDRMRVPFSVGNGQFVLHDAAINGPILGATLRGSIDFKRERINVSGTYIPFFGINGAIGLVPILGDLLVSRNGEGLFGITFAVKGPNSSPDVLVNPMSMVAPGFLRQLFEFDQTEQRAMPPEKRSESQSGGAPAVTR